MCLSHNFLAELQSLHYLRGRLELRRTHTAVQTFYLSLGLRLLDELPVYSQDKKDFRRMELMLND